MNSKTTGKTCVFYDLTDPCSECPFRKGGVRLSRERIVGIVTDIRSGNFFECHTCHGSQQCAGADIFLVKSGWAVSQGRQIAGRLADSEWAAGIPAPAELNTDHPEVFGSLDEFLAESFEAQTTIVETEDSEMAADVNGVEGSVLTCMQCFEEYTRGDLDGDDGFCSDSCSDRFDRELVEGSSVET